MIALARGGVPIGVEIAKKLELPHDVLIVRKIGFPGNPEYAIGAISHNNTQILDHNLIKRYNIAPSTVREIIRSEKHELNRRTHLYRENDSSYELTNQTIILTDDGIATGSTINVAIESYKSARANNIVLAIPVAEKNTLSRISPLFDDVFCLHSPDTFSCVGQFYENFNPVTDEEVLSLIQLLGKNK